MKKSSFIQALIGISILVGCGTPQLPAAHFANPNLGAPAPLLGIQSNSPASSLALTDNFTQYMRSKIRSESMPFEQQIGIEGTQVPQLPAAQPKALTYMTYEALDNNLFQDLNRVLDTLEFVGSTPQMNLVAQTDNYAEDNTARYYISRDTQMPGIKSQYQKLDGVENSGDTRVFADAVRWGFSNYPSRVKWLNISTHGMGFAGINYDDVPNSSMNIMQFSQAVRQGLGNSKLDILSFDACLMATVEVASEVQDVANILVGSEDSTYYWGYGYYKTFSKIAPNPAAMNPDQVARSMVVDVHAKGQQNMTLTISATDTRKIGLLESELDRLARKLRQLMPTHKDAIIRAMKATQEFHLGENIPFRDINRMVSLLKRYVQDQELHEICAKINHVMYRRGVIMFSRQNKLEQGEGRGLSIYLPTTGQVSQLYRQTRFARNTQWDEFLLELNQAVGG